MQIRHLETQMYPHSQQYLVKAFENATKKHYSYLFLDSHQTTPNIARVRARILPNQRPMVLYADKRLYGDIITSKFLKAKPQDLHPQRFEDF